jgi:two-component system chemotaxis family response regulator WspR
VEDLRIVHEYSGASQYVTVSIGGSVIVPGGDEEALKLIDIADKALYEAKKQGRNRVKIEE